MPYILQDLEARLVKLKAQEASKLLQQMAQTKAFGQLNVTILCPRAECTVSGERIEMDSWQVVLPGKSLGDT